MKENRTILMLEDDEVDVMAVKRALRDLKVMNPVATAATGEEGMQWFLQNSPNLPCLILLDINMPVMNGIEFLRWIKADERYKMIPIVALTSSREETDRVGAFELGVAGYMIKPVDPDKYLSVMKTISIYWQTSELPF